MKTQVYELINTRKNSANSATRANFVMTIIVIFTRFIAKFFKFLIAVLMALTPISAVILMGWYARLSERRSIKYLYDISYGKLDYRYEPYNSVQEFSKAWPSWFASEETILETDKPACEDNYREYFTGGLWASITLGIKSLIALAIITLPFSALWLLGWWSGWQNSFTKGYENAFAGPVISLIGISIALTALSYLPMARAHFSMERRLSAFFEISRVVQLIRNAGWRYILLALCYVIAALPIFFATASPTFIEQMRPDILTMSPDEIDKLRGGFHFWTSIYIVLAHIFITISGARIYARSLTGLYAGDRQEWEELRLIQIAKKYPFEIQPVKKALSGKFHAIFMSLILAAIWFGLVAQIFVGQFMNYKYWSWLNHPLIQIPWFPPLGPWN